MSQFLTVDYLISFLFSVIRMSTPIIFCALGALIANHAGAINMALEGIMLTASLIAVMFSAWLQSCWAGLLGAVIGGLLMSLVGIYFFLPVFMGIGRGHGQNTHGGKKHRFRHLLSWFCKKTSTISARVRRGGKTAEGTTA